MIDGDTALEVALAEPDTAEVHDSTEAGSADENDSMNVQNAEAAAGDASAAAEIVSEDAVSPDAAEAKATEISTEQEEQTVSEEAAATAADEPAQNEIAAFDHNAAIEILESEETADYEEEAAADEEIKENEAYTTDDVIPDTLSNAVIYRNVYPGVDLKYETVSYSTKESIILNEEAKGADSYSFVFSLNLTEMYPVLNEDGSITLYKQDSQGEAAYTLPVPFMTDASGDFSDSVSYTLLEQEGSWQLGVTADAAWINAEERAFPVVIDPTIISSRNESQFVGATATETDSTAAVFRSWVGCGYHSNGPGLMERTVPMRLFHILMIITGM